MTGEAGLCKQSFSGSVCTSVLPGSVLSLTLFELLKLLHKGSVTVGQDALKTNNPNKNS